MSVPINKHEKNSPSAILLVLVAVQSFAWGCGKTTFGAFGGGEKAETASNPNAAGDGDALGGEAVTDTFSVTAVAKASQVDVIVLFDTSGSMDDEMGKLRAELPNFVKNLQSNLSNEDFQLFLLMSQTDLSYEKQGEEPVISVDMKVGSHDALQVLAKFLAEQRSGKYPALRANAALELIIVSDDDASIKVERNRFDKNAEQLRVSPIDFFNEMLKTHNLEARTRLHGLVFMPEGAETSWCTRAADGKAYIEIAAATKGVVKHLCHEEWDKMLADFGSEIIATVKSNSKKLSKPMHLPALDQMKVEINAVVVDAKCYSFVAETNTIAIDKSCLSQSESEVKVTYIPKA